MIEVLKQAIEALEYFDERAATINEIQVARPVLLHLRQASKELESQEPVAWWIVSKTTDEKFVSARPNDWNDINWEKHKLYTAPPQRTEQEHMTPWSQKTIEQKIEASVRHYTKEIERAKEVGDPHQFVGAYEGFVVCLESILEKNT
jgi:hypothetical protein